MAKKISQLESAVDVTASDLIQIVDVEDGDMAPSGTNKKATAQLLANELGKLTNVTATGSTTSRLIADRFADVVNVRDFGDEDGIGDVTLNVPSEYPTIQAAFDYLRTKRIASGTTVKIQVADGTHTLTSLINANHPDGSQIQLLGNQTTAANCVLQVVGESTFDAIAVSSGNVLGFLNGFRIRSTVKATLANNTTGVLAVQNSTIICGNKVEVDNFYYGIAARDGSYIYCPSAIVTNAGDVGIWAFCGSTIVANGATSNGASDTINGYGFGFQAEFGSTLVATGASASGCFKAGIAALSNSTCRTHNSVCNANVGSGFLSWAGGQVECSGSTSTNNQRYGVEITEYGNVIGVTTNTGNTLGSLNNFAFLSEAGGQARIASSIGSMRVDAGDASSIYFNTSGGLQFAIDHTASAVNRFSVKGSTTGSGLSLNATGSDTNISTNINSKGNGVVRLNSNGKSAFQAYSPTSNSVNYLQADSSETGVGVTLSSQGDDSVIDLKLTPKGAGSYIQLGSGHTSTSDVPISGYIQIKDSTGTIRKLAVIS